MTEELLPLVAAERRLVADDVAGLTDAQLDTPSLCGEWSVREVAAHLAVPLVVPLRRFGVAMVAARGRFDRANHAIAVDLARQRPPAELVAALREHATSRFHPPGFGLEAPLTDLVIHGEDLRRPLGLSRPVDPAALRVCLDLVITRRAEGTFRARGLGAGRTLVATDLDWRHGAGPVVAAPALDLLMGLAGRPAPGLDLR